MPLALPRFCFCLTLQVGLVMLASVFFTLSGIILAVNVFDRHDSVGVLFMILLVLMFLIAGVLMMVTSNNYNKTVALVGLVVIVLVTCYWIILCVLSFVDGESFVPMVCIGKRCPESFWIASVSYRKQLLEELVEDRGAESVNCSEVFNTSTVSTFVWELEQTTTKNLKNFKNNFKSNYYNIPFSKNDSGELVNNKKNTLPPRIDTNLLHGNNSGNHTEDKNEEPDIIVGEPLIGAVIFMVVNFVFLVFSAVVAYSWVVQTKSLRESSI